MDSEKVERVFRNKLLAVSSWGTGWALLFAIFGGRAGLSKEVFQVLDAVLACSVAVCFLWITYLFASAFGELRGDEVKDVQLGGAEVFLGLVFSLLLMLGGFIFFDYLPAEISPTKTATTLGALTFAFGLILTLVGVKRVLLGAGR